MDGNYGTGTEAECPAQAGQDEQRVLKRRELLDRLPPGSLAVFDQPYIPGAGSTGPVDYRQTLDLYIPPGTGLFPLVIWIHGGGWNACDKDTDAAPGFLSSGFALASINYRLIGDGHPFPAQIEDCFSALAWLRQNGEEHHIDSRRIGVFGHSAGAHLAGMILTTGGTDLFSKTQNGGGQVQGAVLLSGPLDLVRERGNWPAGTFVWNPEDAFCRYFFPGGVYDEDFARWASPASYLHPGVPPVLVVHGGADTLVPFGQALAFTQALKKTGTEAIFYLEPESGHDTLSPENYSGVIRFFNGIMR